MKRCLMGNNVFFIQEIKETMDSVGTESEWKTIYARYKINPWDTEENAKIITENSPIVKFSSLQRSRNGFNKRFDPNLVNDIFGVDKELTKKKPLIDEYNNNANNNNEQFGDTNDWKWNDNEPSVPTVPPQWNTDLWSEEKPLQSRSPSKQAKQSSLMLQALEQKKKNQQKEQRKYDDKVEEEKVHQKRQKWKAVEEEEENEELQQINEGDDIFNPIEFLRVQPTDLKQINVKSQIKEVNQKLIKDEILLDSNIKQPNKSSQQIDF
eukprot:TRINITY_DN6263_c0_g2_i1.p1 TRINITY_DN6263_c0_g2~~TRINITY_DN6263_c0_g2_i1.p1  ORF type:complete len:266 (-),score=62.14 TRINITY_DN6263_c0_g2_i1:65-862(-)